MLPPCGIIANLKKLWEKIEESFQQNELSKMHHFPELCIWATLRFINVQIQTYVIYILLRQFKVEIFDMLSILFE